MEIKAIKPEVVLPESKGPKDRPLELGREFSGLLKDYLSKVNVAHLEAESKVADLASGKEADIVGTMISLAKADLKFRLLLQTRNRVLSAYEEIMRMQL